MDKKLHFLHPVLVHGHFLLCARLYCCYIFIFDFFDHVWSSIKWFKFVFRKISYFNFASLFGMGIIVKCFVRSQISVTAYALYVLECLIGNTFLCCCYRTVDGIHRVEQMIFIIITNNAFRAYFYLFVLEANGLT